MMLLSTSTNVTKTTERYLVTTELCSCTVNSGTEALALLMSAPEWTQDQQRQSVWLSCPTHQ